MANNASTSLSKIKILAGHGTEFKISCYWSLFNNFNAGHMIDSKSEFSNLNVERVPREMPLITATLLRGAT